MGKRYNKGCKVGHKRDWEAEAMARQRIAELRAERDAEFMADWRNARTIVYAMRLAGMNWQQIGDKYGFPGFRVKAMTKVQTRPSAPEFKPLINAIIEAQRSGTVPR